MTSENTAREAFSAMVKMVGPKPDDSADRATKKRYSEQLSECVAQQLAEQLRGLGMSGTRPDLPGGDAGVSGAERRLAGGIGAKKVDVSWATEESGLLLGVTIKTINFRDVATKNYQKNLTNRRGDLLFETVTLHRRFPYAVVVGFLFLDEGAESDGTETRASTYANAHDAFRMFTGRVDPAGRDEQLELMYIVLQGQRGNGHADVRVYLAGQPDREVAVRDIFDEILRLIVERNADFYEIERRSGLAFLAKKGTSGAGQRRKAQTRKKGAGKAVGKAEG